MHINIVVCDDNEFYYQQIKDFILKCKCSTYYSFSFKYYKSGKELLMNIENYVTPDIIFLDIELREEHLGTEVGLQIKKLSPNILIISTSSFTCFYKQLVISEPFDFLEKPLTEESIEETLIKATKRLHYLKQNFTYTYKSGGLTNKVNLKDVKYFESRHRIIIIHTCNGESYQFYEKLDTVEQNVESIYPYFIRINKSFYVNYHYIKNFSNNIVTIDENIIKISNKYKKECAKKLFSLF